MAGVSGQPGTKPSQVTSPVPGDEAKLTADAFLSSFDNSSPPGGAPQAPSADSFLAQFDAGAAPAAENFNSVSDQPMTDQQAYGGEFEQNPSMMQANVDQFKPENIKDRMIYGLAANDEEAVGAMRAKYGDKNVVVKNGQIHYRREDGEKFKRLDPDTLEFFADFIPDGTRMAVQEAAMLPAEAIGAAAGFVSGAGIGSVPAAAIGGRAARVAMTPFANMAADKVAELAGVPQDENRNKWAENGIGMAAEAFLPVIGGQIAKRIPGTQAYKVAKVAGERDVVALSRQSKEVVQAANALNEAGIDAPLLLHQVHPNDPKVKKLLAQVQGSGELIQREQEIAEGYGQSLRNNLQAIARRGNMGPSDNPEKLAAGITNAVETLDKAEGQTIGKYKLQAMKNLKGQKVPLPPKTNEEVVGIMKELGFKPSQQKTASITRRDVANPITGAVDTMGRRNEVPRTKWTPPADINPILGRLGITDPGQARSAINVLKEYGDMIGRGGQVRLQDLDQLIDRMGAMNPKLQGTKAAATWGKITGELRQHRREIIGSALGDDYSKKAFNDAMDEFSLIRQNTQELSSMLGDNRSTKSIVNYFFQGKDNVNRIDALRAITGGDSPQWGQLKEEFINQLVTKHSSPDSATGFNSKAFMKDLQTNYGDGFIRKVLNDGKNGPNFETVKNLLTYGERIEGMSRAVKNVETAPEAQKKGLVDAVIGMGAGLKFKVVNGVMNILGAGSGQEKALFEILNRDGIDKYVQDYPGKINKPETAKFLGALLNRYNDAKREALIGRTVRGLGKYEMSRDKSSATETVPESPQE